MGVLNVQQLKQELKGLTDNTAGEVNWTIGQEEIRVLREETKMENKKMVKDIENAVIKPHW